MGGAAREGVSVDSKAKGLTSVAPAISIRHGVAASGVAGAPVAVAPALQPCRILLVEDHADTAAMMRRLLGRRGYAVTLATTVAEALQAATSQPFDLLISDLGLPDGSGLDLMRDLASCPARLPGIALSGYGMPDDARKSLDAGFLEHLTKPVAMERLWATIDRVLAMSLATNAA